ncbi:hypothetical protein RPE78_05935 [Thioclava litoralis]|uniref:Inner membrane protein n=1 Tax=Thioclava litoralis TaxID=3076557 RepID=A0ABZ1E4V5_9RHOB|nr:hypothetical protein RPE78_05935 [Thioclava sp. FTW29]
MAAPEDKKSEKPDAAKDESVTPESVPAVPEPLSDTLTAQKPADTAPEAEEVETDDPLEGRNEGLAEETAFGSDDIVAAEQVEAEQKEDAPEAGDTAPVEAAPLVEPETPEPAVKPAVAPVASHTVVEKRGGFGALLAGGVVAAVIGAAAAIWALPQLPQDLQARIFPPQPAFDSSALEGSVADLSSQVSALQQSVSVLQDNMAAMGQSQGQSGGGDISGLQEQITALQSKLEGVTGPNAAAAEEAERRARARAAIAQIRAALLNGTPIAEPVAQARDAKLDVPEALGIEPQSTKALQEAFPAPARSALDAARRADAGDNLGARIETFLLTQTGARSVAPQEGSGPDAVLSRAQAAVDAGDFKTAITEISALPQVSQDILSGWVAQAQKRVAAEEAVASLASQVQ